ncbi:hypothetical protein [Mycobacterium angelicum]|uniref:hypothetical protein n=1 Tax=Mycobacterium angelicum TaxID=470074 RepID=UPI00111C18F6|nr:hypothetical protein [Mycobacterium angelicum]MCV7199971.1 hypothetical protein [Mycobacterium angelicum]
MSDPLDPQIAQLTADVYAVYHDLWLRTSTDPEPMERTLAAAGYLAEMLVRVGQDRREISRAANVVTAAR